jgi:hypothetical protein
MPYTTCLPAATLMAFGALVATGCSDTSSMSGPSTLTTTFVSAPPPVFAPTMTLMGPVGTTGFTVHITLTLSAEALDVVVAFGDGTDVNLGRVMSADVPHTYPGSGPFMAEATATFADGTIVKSSTGLSIR